jgi:predicted SprT family Zn-dependent metalloprotease
MKLPTHFKLHGITYTVRLDDNLITNNDNLGEAGYRRSEIVLQKVLPGVAITEQRFEQVFYHELVHLIMHEMHDKHRDNEAFVDVFASLLHQALSTMEYE